MLTVDSKAVRARYQSDCPACRKLIAIGHPVKPYNPNGEYRKRTRWQHEDCDNVPAVDSSASATDEAVRQVVHVALQEIARLGKRIDEVEQRQPRVIDIRRQDAEPVKIDGAVHPAFERVLQLAAVRKNIFLPGPAGCGKTHMAAQVAEALGLRFAFISCSAGMSEGQLLGRLLPVGDNGTFTYVPADFVRCYEEGGVFLFDEMDAADSNVLLVINSALANGKLALPNRPEKPYAERHPDFVCIAAANTFGRGGDRQYVGRNELDEATVDRFRIGTVPMDYDSSLEATLSPDEALRQRLVRYRERVRSNRLERVVSTRFLKDAHEMVAVHGWTYNDVDAQLFQGWRQDEVAKVTG